MKNVFNRHKGEIILFTIVEISENKVSKWKSFLQRFTRPEVSVSEENLPNGKCFYICNAKIHRGKIPWREIKRLSSTENYLLPLSLNDDTEIKEYTPVELPQIMLFNSAVSYIEKQNLSPSKTHVTVVDKKGLHVEKIRSLVKLASSVTVITDEDIRYTELSDELFDSYGISLIIRSEFYTDSAKNSFLFDFDGENVPLSYNGTVFSKTKMHLLNGKALTPGGFYLPSEYERLLRKDINKLYFASALYELCGVNELSLLQFNELCS